MAPLSLWLAQPFVRSYPGSWFPGKPELCTHRAAFRRFAATTRRAFPPRRTSPGPHMPQLSMAASFRQFTSFWRPADHRRCGPSPPPPLTSARPTGLGAAAQPAPRGCAPTGAGRYLSECSVWLAQFRRPLMPGFAGPRCVFCSGRAARRAARAGRSANQFESTHPSLGQRLTLCARVPRAAGAAALGEARQTSGRCEGEAKDTFPPRNGASRWPNG